MPDYLVLCYWTMRAVVLRTASSPEEAEQLVMDEAELPEGEYVEDSFTVADVNPAP